MEHTVIGGSSKVKAVFTQSESHGANHSFHEKMAPEYERLPDSEETLQEEASVQQQQPKQEGQEALQSSSTSQNSSPQKQMLKPEKPLAKSSDGVFTNLSAKPSAQSPTLQPSAQPQQSPPQEELPSYDAAAQDSTPPYQFVQVINSHLYGENEDLYDIGTPYMFVLTAMCTITFQLVGFLLCFLFSRSLAGKAGARFGFGFVLIQLGGMTRQRKSDDSGDEYISYLIIILGMVVMLSASYQYAAARRQYLLHRAVPPSVQVAEDVV